MRTPALMEAAEQRFCLAALTSLPLLHSLPFAQAKLFIDFDGNPPIANWLSFSVPATPAYNTDANNGDFSASELADINEIWSRVAEMYSPFNIDVTTEDPGNRDNRRTSQIIVGGSVDDWFMESAGGVAPIGAFYNGAPNVGFVFSDDAFGDTVYLGQAVGHEAGHTFGLLHHSTFNPDGTLDEEYDPGNGIIGPIMGFPDQGSRMLWANTASNVQGAAVPQDDLAILSGGTNGYGYRFDDWGNSRLSGGALTPDLSGNVTVKGVIERTTDLDAFSFKSGAGTLTIDLDVAQFAPMLDASVKVFDPFGNIVAQRATASLGETLSVNIQAGTYGIVVESAGGYGDLGQFTLDVHIPPGVGSSDHLLVEGTDFDDVITINLVENAYQLVINGELQTLDPGTIKNFDILAGEGNDLITIGDGVGLVYCLGGGGNDTMIGGDKNDTFSGSAGNDMLVGNGGDDRLAGGNGHDVLIAGNGADRLFGDAGNDLLTGGAHVDRLYGGDGHDVLSGESSADKAYGDAGQDTIYGGNGNDLLNGGEGIDQLWGGEGDDGLYAADGIIELVNGGGGNDIGFVDNDEDLHDIRQSLEQLA